MQSVRFVHSFWFTLIPPTASLGQKVRIYIYGAVLYYFEIAEKPVPLDVFVNGQLWILLFSKSVICADLNYN